MDLLPLECRRYFALPLLTLPDCWFVVLVVSYNCRRLLMFLSVFSSFVSDKRDLSDLLALQQHSLLDRWLL
jgi:hypothetical protein